MTFISVQCIIEQLLDSVLVISRIIEVLVRDIILSLWLRLITSTSTFIILHITKTLSNNCLFSDDKGILSCCGRLKNAPILYDARFPIFLPRCSRFNYLAVNDCHFKAIHNGARDTLTELGLRFWATKGKKN